MLTKRIRTRLFQTTHQYNSTEPESSCLYKRGNWEKVKGNAITFHQPNLTQDTFPTSETNKKKRRTEGFREGGKEIQNGPAPALAALSPPSTASPGSCADPGEPPPHSVAPAPFPSAPAPPPPSPRTPSTRARVRTRAQLGNSVTVTQRHGTTDSRRAGARRHGIHST